MRKWRKMEISLKYLQLFPFHSIPNSHFTTCPPFWIFQKFCFNKKGRRFLLKQEAITTASTRGYNIFAKFCCRQSKLLQSSRIFSAPHCGKIASYLNNSSWGHRSYYRRNFISSASFKTTKFLPRWICSGTLILRVDSAYRSSLSQKLIN